MANERAKIITLVCNKGGVGRSTTTINTAWRLAEFGKKVLVVDLDAQCNTSMTLAGDYVLDVYNSNRNLVECIGDSRGSFTQYKIDTRHPNLSLLGATIYLDETEDKIRNLDRAYKKGLGEAGHGGYEYNTEITVEKIDMEKMVSNLKSEIETMHEKIKQKEKEWEEQGKKNRDEIRFQNDRVGTRDAKIRKLEKEIKDGIDLKLAGLGEEMNWGARIKRFFGFGKVKQDYYYRKVQHNV